MLRLLAAICFLVSVSGQPDKASDQENHVAQQQPPSAPTTNAHDSNCCTTNAPQQSNKKTYRWYEPLERPDWWVVVIASLTGMVIGWQSWETRKAAEASLIGAKANDAQVQMLKDKERARIAVKVFRLDTLSFYESNVIKIEIENFGPTHAFNVRATGDARAIIEDEEPLETEFDDLIYPNEGVIRASSPPLNASLSFFFPEEWFSDRDPCAESLIAIEVFGAIEYEDVFGRSHTTRFNYFMNVSTTKRIPSSNSVKIHPSVSGGKLTTAKQIKPNSPTASIQIRTLPSFRSRWERILRTRLSA